jgi:DNA repair protein RecN (Recombination protein N)
MLSKLSIKNFAIIDDIQISFKEGFSVLTGETGAGKSIILEAVNLLLGSRASAELVRSGCKNAELEAFFEIDEKSNAGKMLENQGIENCEGLIIRRIITSSGRSRVYINSRQSTLELLKQVTYNLAGVSSQHAHQRLLKEENHLEILDEFAGTIDLKNEVQKLYGKIIPLKKMVDKLEYELEQKKKEQEFLLFQIEEIHDAKILPNEDEKIEKTRQNLLNAAKTFEAVNAGIHEIHDKEGSIIEKLSFLRNSLDKLSTSEKELDKISEHLSSSLFDLQDIAHGLRDFSSCIDLDPASLEQADERLDLISRLKRKYGGSLESMFREYEAMQLKISNTGRLKDKIKTSKNEIQGFLKKIEQHAQKLSGLRQTAGKKLSKLAGKELDALEMGKAKFEVSFDFQITDNLYDISTSDKKQIRSDGMDRVRFLLSPNPGEALKPLVKIASGGELSRIVLALKAVLSQNNSLETLIFDEVDAGVGGATSEKVGFKLNKLSQKHQVICITHLAQIAKYAVNHFRISKKFVKDRTFTTILPLKESKQRVEEIARMIGGKEITNATLRHAKELLDQTLS